MAVQSDVKLVLLNSDQLMSRLDDWLVAYYCESWQRHVYVVRFVCRTWVSFGPQVMVHVHVERKGRPGSSLVYHSHVFETASLSNTRQALASDSLTSVEPKSPLGIVLQYLCIPARRAGRSLREKSVYVAGFSVMFPPSMETFGSPQADSDDPESLNRFSHGIPADSSTAACVYRRSAGQCFSDHRLDSSMKGGCVVTSSYMMRMHAERCFVLPAYPAIP